jgi:hypothetical protein
MKRSLGAAAAMTVAGVLLAACGGNFYGGGDVGFVGPLTLDQCGGYYDGSYGPTDDSCRAEGSSIWARGHDDPAMHPGDANH